MKKENSDKPFELGSVPDPTVRRLSHYRYLLDKLKNSGRIIVSSTLISSELYIDAIQVKKDIQYTGIFGQPKKGYKINELLDRIDEILNWGHEERAFLVGAGSLGHAMLGYNGFNACGLKFVAAFDKERTLVGSKIHDVEVFDIEHLVEMGKMTKVKIGVITVPSVFAQEVADRLVEAGVKAIWNFASIRLSVPEGIIIENAQFVQSLAVLTHKLGRLQRSVDID